MKELFICFYCAEVFEVESYDISEIKCNQCGATIRYKRYKTIFNYAKDAIEYGYNYREVYEEDFKIDGKITKHYYLESLGNLETFISGAILGGIVGGLSYDTIKKIVKIIVNKFSKNYKPSRRVTELINDDLELMKLIYYLQDYHNNFLGLNPEIVNAIEEEMFVHKLTEIMKEFEKKYHPTLLAGNTVLQEQYMEDLKNIKKQIKERQKLGDGYFKEFWKNIRI